MIWLEYSWMPMYLDQNLFHWAIVDALILLKGIRPLETHVDALSLLSMEEFSLLFSLLLYLMTTSEFHEDRRCSRRDILES